MRFLDQRSLLQEREKSVKVKMAFMKQISNLKQKGLRLELMGKVEDSIIQKIDEKMTVEPRLEEQGTGYMQG